MKRNKPSGAQYKNLKKQDDEKLGNFMMSFLQGKQKTSETESVQSNCEKEEDEDSSSSQPDPCCSSGITTELETSETSKMELYRGCKLDPHWLARQNPCLVLQHFCDGKRKRPYMKCDLCSRHKPEVLKKSLNGRLPIADGIRCDSDSQLKLIVDHLLSEIHKTAKDVEKFDNAWKTQSNSHPWAKLSKSHRPEVINFLLRLAVDAYNDALCETPSASSWPARSLAALAGDFWVSSIGDHGWDFQFASFNPPACTYHYRSPQVYAEMQSIVSSIVQKKVADEINESLAVCLQIDGSVDRQMMDNKFITARYVTKETPPSVSSAFLRVVVPETNGAVGLLEATETTLEQLGISQAKICGITTDGEAANTGQDRGLWTLLRDKLGREILTIWCTCFRSDLAFERVEQSVPELRLWKINIKELAKSFRASKNKTKLLSTFHSNFVHFPRYFEVRFSEHLNSLISAVLHNIDGCRKVWTELKTSGDSFNEKQQCAGFLKTWEEGGTQLHLTRIMGDLCSVFQELQKGLQKSDLLLPDVITLRDLALRKLDLMKAKPKIGGKE